MKWKTSWGYEPIDYGKTIGRIEETACRMYAKNNLSGNRVRVRFSNRYGNTPLHFQAVRISDGRREQAVTYQGRAEITIHAGEEFYSDAVNLPVQAGNEIMVDIFVGEVLEIGSVCTTFSAGGWSAWYRRRQPEGESSAGRELEEIFPFVKEEAIKPQIIFGFTEIQVLTDSNVREILLFGDSLTHMSFYSDALAERLYRKYPGKVSVINGGICGNRVLRDAMEVERFAGNGREMGRSGIGRAEGQYRGCTDIAVILEGINDILQPYGENRLEEAVTSGELIQGLSQLIFLLKKTARQVYIGTLPPFQSRDATWPYQCENIRQECNQWIREQRLANGFVDFDRAVADRVNPCRMAEGLHLGDGVHPNTEGGILMAEEVMHKCFGERGNV